MTLLELLIAWFVGAAVLTWGVAAWITRKDAAARRDPDRGQRRREQ
jgi:hypothetical protein